MSVSGVSVSAGYAALLQKLQATQAGQILPGNLLSSSSTDSPLALSVSSSSSSSSTDGTSQEDAIAKLSKYLEETPAQRMMDDWLSQHGITQDQFDQMTDTEKQKLIQQMKQDLETKMKEKIDKAQSPGSVLNISI